jgi:PhnB protein
VSVPELSIHLSFNGDCAEAFSFYAAALGAEIGMMMTYAESPMAGHVPASDLQRVMHARLTLGTHRIMGADAVTGHPYTGSAGFSVSLAWPTVGEARQAFEALSEGGTVVMPFAPTFWSPGFGVLTDRFGVSWMLTCEQSAP